MSAPHARPGVEMLIIPPCCRDEAEIVAIAAVPGRLHDVPRLPGESVRALIQRALHAVTGRGPLLVHFRLRDHQPQDAVTRLA